MENHMSNREPDHEYPWIEVESETRDIHCTVCDIHDNTENWMGFLTAHETCDDVWNYPRILKEEII